MKNYKNRDRKQKAKKNRMIKSGRSLLTVIEPIIKKRAEKIKTQDNKT